MTLRFGEESLQEIARVSAEVSRLSASRSSSAFLEHAASTCFDQALHFSNAHSSRHDSEPAFAAATPCQTGQNGLTVSPDRICLPNVDATAVCLSHVQKSRLLPAFRLLTRVFALLCVFSEPQVNTTVENIGARRLHTLMERILEDVSYSAGDAEVTNPHPHMFSSRAN